MAGALAEAIELMSRAGALPFAAHVPSGFDADTGG
jgi:NAD(P)H-hydrate repair Nnr-like enzyme with NAD(P)H-hydrate epimerase domain